MTDDIDTTQAIQQHRRTAGFHKYRKCGTMINADEYPFCQKLKVAEPVKRTWWVGRRA